MRCNCKRRVTDVSSLCCFQMLRDVVLAVMVIVAFFVHGSERSLSLFLFMFVVVGTPLVVVVAVFVVSFFYM